MKKEYLITVDYGCDLSMEECIKNKIIPLQLSYVVDNKLLKDSLDKNDYLTVYKKMRKGKKTSIVSSNVYVYLDFFYKLLNRCSNILHICEGSIDSNNFKWASLARELLKEEVINSNIVIINSNAMSLGAGMIGLKASEMRENNFCLEEVVSWIENNKENINGIFACSKGKQKDVNSTQCLKKAILKLKANGCLELTNEISIKNLKTLVKSSIDCNSDQTNNQTLYISHSDNEKQAKIFGEQIKEELGFKNVYYSFMGPSVVSNIGPNYLGVFFLGQKRI